VEEGHVELPGESPALASSCPAARGTLGVLPTTIQN